MRVAFYAPLKSPTHQTPSGDRRMGRLLMSALETAGHTVNLASDFRSFEGHGDAEKQQVLAAEGQAVADTLVSNFTSRSTDKAPDLWFTYHLYYKAPDYVGPVVAKALNIPYVVAEPSYAPKRAGGAWDHGHQTIGSALRQAAAVLCLTRHDIACVEPLMIKKERLYHLPPFLNTKQYHAVAASRAINRKSLLQRFDIDPNKSWLMAVGMMRPGDKLHSYKRLAKALEQLGHSNWQLLTVGDGEARAGVEEAFADFGPAQVFHLGAIEPGEMPKILSSADIFVWPAAGEAYGMAMLEAQACGIPVVAGKVRGVPEVVQDGLSGILVPEDNPQAFADAVNALISDPQRRKAMADAAKQFVLNERSVENAATILDKALFQACSDTPT